MKIELYDVVLLKDGRRASVVERLGEDYVVDIDMGGDYDTRLIPLSEIVKVLE